MMQDRTYELHIGGVSEADLRVQAFSGTESLSGLYDFDIEIVDRGGSRNLPREALGRSATFVLRVSDTPRVFHGVVSEVELLALETHQGAISPRYRVQLVPRLWLLTQRRNSRIFQGLRVDQVISRVLAEYQIAATFLLRQERPERRYCTQYEETDYEFVCRLAAEDGLFFFYEQAPWAVGELSSLVEEALGSAAVSRARDGLENLVGPTGLPAGDVLLFADDAAWYPVIGSVPTDLSATLSAGLERVASQVGSAASRIAPFREALTALGIAGSPALQFVPDGDALVHSSREVVTTMTSRDAVRSQSASFRTFDPRRPNATLSAQHQSRPDLTDGPVEAAPGEALRAAGSVLQEAAQALNSGSQKTENTHRSRTMDVYEHHDHYMLPHWDYRKHEPERILRSAQRDSRIARGRSLTPRLASGHRFALESHPLDWMNREYTIVEVRHRGRSFDANASEANGDGAVYDNDFSCVPSGVTYLPSRPHRMPVQACLTATVIGAGEELYTHGMAEVKVRFHWDREASGGDSTCWIRTTQAWGGAGWGTQFMPRVGMEVVVGFDGGDPDKPIILGCLYNGVHPAPFALPEHQTRSGIRTRSTPGATGHNELSFEDKAGHEQVYVHAERDFDTMVEHDRTVVVRRDDTTDVQHDQALRVQGARETRVEGGQSTFVSPQRHTEIAGNDTQIVTGQLHQNVRGDAHMQVTGNERRRVETSAELSVGGDLTERVSGNRTMLVGTHDEPKMRSVRVEGATQVSASGQHELASDEEMTIRCGASFIRLTQERIEICAPEVALRADGVSLLLSESDARFVGDGSLQAVMDTVLLKSFGATFGLGSEASIEGSRVLLNSPSQAQDAVEDEPREMTVIELTDDEGQPLAYQRYRVDLEDGTSMAGVLDSGGRAEIALETAGTIVFPDLPEVEPA